MPKLTPLPIIEHWDCHSCGLCCRDSIVPLDDEDQAVLRSQKWEEHPDFRGIATTARIRTWGSNVALAKKDDGSCVFLTAAGLCRIHEIHGFDAKPKICRQFPLQLVPLDHRVLVATRRSCPTAARGVGRPVSQYFGDLQKLIPDKLEEYRPLPPEVVAGHRRDWRDTLAVTAALERLMCDTRFPLVRRIIHSLEFCDLLADCSPRKLRKIDSKNFAELIRVAAESVYETAGQWFADRQPLRRGSAAAFRQAAAETMRLYPQLHSRETWRDRVRMLRIVLSITRGNGKTPKFLPELPQTDFSALEQPLGALDLELIRPLDDYFQTMTVSLRYCTLAYRKWPVVEGFRSLAMQFPIALWCWRWSCGEKLDGDKLIPIIVCLDRTHTVSVLTGWRHRRRVDALAASRNLQRLCAWYAR